MRHLLHLLAEWKFGVGEHLGEFCTAKVERYLITLVAYSWTFCMKLGLRF